MKFIAILIALLGLCLPLAGQQSCDAGSFFCGNTIGGEIANGSCPTGCLEYSQSHRFNVFGNTTLVTLTATAADFTSAIEVVDSEGVVVARKEGRGNEPTRLTAVLQPAIYSARVIALPAGSSGMYTLRLSCLLGDPQVFCWPDETTLCLHDRFSITAAVRVSQGGPSIQGAVARSDERYGIFSASALTNDPDNPEVLVKVLDGRPINGRWWIFVGGLTGFDYDVTVRDTFTKREKTYSKDDVMRGEGIDTGTFQDR